DHAGTGVGVAENQRTGCTSEGRAGSERETAREAGIELFPGETGQGPEKTMRERV
ncbi:MAG: hypothetical protein Q9191_008409, partial [Dirinaria sp. TL-2023a]